MNRGELIVRRVLGALLIGFIALTADVQAQSRDGVDRLLQQLNVARSSGDQQATAALASELAARDLSATFEPAEARTVLASLAEILLQNGDVSQASLLYDRLIAESSRDASVSEGARQSARRIELATYLERRGDLREANGARDAAISDYRAALGTVRAALGADEPQTRFVLAKLIEASARAGQPEPAAELARLQDLQRAAGAEPLSALGEETRQTPYESVRVFFGASRDATGAGEPERAYGPMRSQLTLGSVLVTVPRNRTIGSIPRPGLFDLRGPQDGVHIVLRRMTRYNDDATFTDRLSRSVAASTHGRAAFVYIHGYNEGFADALRRTAQLAVDLDMREGAVLYAWPSGDLLNYQVAQNNVQPSVDELVSLLRAVMRAGADDVHVIAHSMGNRVLLEALDVLKDDSTRHRFAQLVFASPDVDAETFAAQALELRDMAEGMTLYASAHDRALQLSSLLGGGYTRAGQIPLTEGVARSVVAVDTTRMVGGGSDVVGHSDFANDAINDLRAVVWLSLAPRSRCQLRAQASYWIADARRQGCAPQAFRRAISALRLHGPNAQAQIENIIRQLEGGVDRQSVSDWREALAIVSQVQSSERRQ